MTRLYYSLFFALAAVLPSVSAHGYVGSVSIGGTVYAGSMPGHDQGTSPIRTVSTISPVKGATNPDLNCGMDAQLAGIDAPAAPGSNITIQWVGGATGDSKWPHNTGPLMTYMASCDDSCTSFNGSSAGFFKVDQLGQLPSGSGWYQADISQGDSYTFTLPADIAPGAYLIRHEIISLQLANSEGGAEFYPACIQVKISGSGTGTPQSTVTFPGAYSDTDAGILTPNVYNPGFVYDFPGPAISNLAASAQGISPALGAGTFASGTGSTPAATPSGTASATFADPSASSTPSLTSSAVPSASSNAASCKLRASASANSTVNRRSHNRMMRRMRHSS
ncbi:glycosyl hydrolase family 61-domain-containing protein [Sparassis latifolia]